VFDVADIESKAEVQKAGLKGSEPVTWDEVLWLCRKVREYERDVVACGRCGSKTARSGLLCRRCAQAQAERERQRHNVEIVQRIARSMEH
jgi:predicted amidophosphoribosyltransferase